MANPTRLYELSHHHQYDVRSPVYSASHTQNGDILLGTYDAIKIFNETDETINDYPAYNGVNAHRKLVSVISQPTFICILYQTDDSDSYRVDVQVTDPMRRQKIKILQFYNDPDSTSLPLLSASPHNIAVYNSGGCIPGATYRGEPSRYHRINKHRLYIYNLDSERKTTIKLAGILYSIQLVETDGELHLLACIRSRKCFKLVRYEVNTETRRLGQIWEYWDESGVMDSLKFTICVDDFIYLKMDGLKLVIVCSTDGKFF